MLIMKNLKLKSFFVALLALVTLGVQAQQDPDLLATKTTDQTEVTYQDYLKMQDEYLKGKVSKEALLKVFNQVTDQLDELCHPQHKKSVSTTNTTVTSAPLNLNGYVIKANKLKNKALAKN